MAEIIPIVNNNDKIIRYKERSEIKKEDIYRVSALWITNSKNEILLARRAFTKLQNPGRWGPAVAGTVAFGETYIQNIIKESFEEIGLKNIKPIKGPKYRISSNHNFFSQWFFLKIDKDISYFKIDRKEVDSIKWFTKKELMNAIKNNPSEFSLNMKKYVRDLC
jgi:isopentenyldiphosphate isomerase